MTVARRKEPGESQQILIARLRSQAREVAAAIAETFPCVESICLFGSVARGDPCRWSDIDIIVLGSDAVLTPHTLEESVPDRLRPALSISYRWIEAFEAYCRSGALFPKHLALEGVILFDPNGWLARVLATVANPLPRVELERSLERLSTFDDLEPFGSNLLFCLSHLYVLATSVVMQLLAVEGIYEFNRDRAFERLEARRPVQADAINTLRRLQPFHTLVMGGRPQSLPFPYHASGDQARIAVDAIRALVLTPT